VDSHQPAGLGFPLDEQADLLPGLRDSHEEIGAEHGLPVGRRVRFDDPAVLPIQVGRRGQADHAEHPRTNAHPPEVAVEHVDQKAEQDQCREAAEKQRDLGDVPVVSPIPPQEYEAPVLGEWREEGCNQGQERIHPRPATRALAVDRVVVPFHHATGLR
jgi:hypothetical protein